MRNEYFVQKKTEDRYLISFIIPLYNKEKYIGRCLTSICRQQGADIQIIVIDDGSTDGSKDVVIELQKKDKRIEYYYKNNGGEGSARNTGIQWAKGEWIAFIDADDFIDKDYMKVVREYLGKSAECFVMGSYIYKNHKILRPAADKNQLCKEWETSDIDYIYNYMCGTMKGIGTAVWNKIFKRQIIEENEIYFSSLKIGEDTIFCFDYAICSNKWIGVPYYLYYYVQNEDSIMHQYNNTNIHNGHCLMDFYDKFAEKHGIYEQIKPAIGCINVRDIFTILKMINRMYPMPWQVYIVYRKITKDVYYKEKIQWVDVKKLNIKYRVVYYLLKYRMNIALIMMVKLYHVVYKL